MLNVEYHGFGTSPGHIVPQLFAGAGEMHRKMRAESTRQVCWPL